MTTGPAISARPPHSVNSAVDAGVQQANIVAARTLRKLVQSDPHRPRYHFLAPEGHAAPFDPNGAIYWKGKYHLGFVYQTCTRGDFVSNNGDYAWGHAVSNDLVHWTYYPDMLEVTEDWEGGIYSGGAFISREGVPFLTYHARNTINLAHAIDDDLRGWKKSENNPIVRTEAEEPWAGNPFLDPARYSVFDSDVWYDREADAYYLISGGAKPALFKSLDLKSWNYIGALLDGQDIRRNRNEDLSCPDFFEIGHGKHMLLFISHNYGAQYYIGTFKNDKFTVERHARMNWPGGTFFAPEQLRDSRGRNIIWGWIMERKPAHLPDYGWSGIMSLPRVVSLEKDGTVRIEPAEELKLARVAQAQENDIQLKANSERSLAASGKSIELMLEFSTLRGAPVGVKVLASQDRREETIIVYYPELEEIVIDFSKSSVNGPVRMPAKTANSWDGSELDGYPKEVSEQRAPLKLKKSESLKLHIFIDRSVIELFCNGRQVLTQVVYPELNDSCGVAVFTGDADVIVKNIVSWTMAETNAF